MNTPMTPRDRATVLIEVVLQSLMWISVVIAGLGLVLIR